MTFSIPDRSHVVVVARNIIGDYVATLHEGPFEKGQNDVRIDHDLLPGSYVVEIRSRTRTASMLLHVVR